MNNNALFLLLGVGGLYMLTRTKTSAPVTPGGANSYGPIGPSLPAAPIRPTPGDVIKTATGIFNDVITAYGTVKDVVTSIKTSLPASVPTSVPKSVPSNAGDSPPFVPQPITFNEIYGSGGGGGGGGATEFYGNSSALEAY